MLEIHSPCPLQHDLELVAWLDDAHWHDKSLVRRAEYTPVRIGSVDGEWSAG